MPSLESAELPSTLASVGTGAFARCASLASVSFAGGSLERVGTSAFAYCTSLRSVELPGVSNLLGLAFQGCVMLRSASFRGSVGGSALGQFDGCTRLASVSFAGKALSYPWARGTSVTAVAGSGAAKASYTVVAGKAGATYARCLSAGASAAVPAKVSVGGASYAVTSVSAGALKGCKAKTLAVRSASLTKAGAKGCLKGSKVTKVKAPKSKLAAYAKVFSKANSGRSVKVVSI